MSLICPISNKKIFADLYKSVERGNSLTTLCLPGSGNTKMAQHMVSSRNKDPKASESNRYIFVDQAMRQKLIEKYLLSTFQTITGNNEGNLLKQFLAASGKFNIVLIIDNFEYEERFIRLLLTLKSLAPQRCHFIFTILYSKFEELKKVITKDLTFALQNLYEFTYLEEEAAVEWIAEIGNSQVIVDMKKKDYIKVVEYCGGIPFLLKNYLRVYRLLNDHSEVQESIQFEILVKRLWDSFSDAEKHLLRLLYVNPNDRPQGRVIEYLKNAKLLNDSYGVRGRWMEHILDKKSTDMIQIENNNLHWHGYDISDNFTEEEHEFLKELITKREVSRDDLHELVFFDSEYSDWAIDKFISRLRKKVSKVGLDRNIIKTIKGRGYMYNPS